MIKPNIEASPILPGRINLIQIPITIAIGSVIAIVNRPHGDSAKAFTTTKAKIATISIIMPKIPIIATVPTPLPSSSLIISPRLLPSLLVDSHSTTKSCTAPAITTPTTSQIIPGR